MKTNNKIVVMSEEEKAALEAKVGKIDTEACKVQAITYKTLGELIDSLVMGQKLDNEIRTIYGETPKSEDAKACFKRFLMGYYNLRDSDVFIYGAPDKETEVITDSITEIVNNSKLEAVKKYEYEQIQGLLHEELVEVIHPALRWMGPKYKSDGLEVKLTNSEFCKLVREVKEKVEKKPDLDKKVKIYFDTFVTYYTMHSFIRAYMERMASARRWRLEIEDALR